MLMSVLRSLKCVAALLVVSSSSWAGDVLFTGIASALDSGEVLYTEHHHIQKSPRGLYQSSQVRYVDPDGNDMAKKKLDFSSNALMPALTFEDQRTGDVTQVEWRDQSIRLRVRDDDDALEEELSINPEAPQVIDAGFDRLVQQYWQSLLSGESLEFEFLALTRGQFVNLRIEMIDADADEVSFVIRPSNWFVRMLVDPIELAYDRKSRRLVEFVGLTNIEKVQNSRGLGENYRARIRYEYLEAPLINAALEAGR